MQDVSEESLTQRQERMIRQQVVERGITDPRLLDALRQVPRERFFPAEVQEHAFADRATPIGYGQTISQPYIVALMTDRLQVRPEHRVLEIGTGSGYQTAVLSMLARQVFSIERVKPLLDSAWERLMALNVRNVRFRHADGTVGWPEAAPFDRILIGAGAPALPCELLKTQLVDGGIAVLPTGGIEQQMLIEVRRDGEKLVTRDVCACRFVKLIGQSGWADENR